MMKQSQASACGKVILFGEHAVVYGRPAIAVPVTNVQATASLRQDHPGAGFRIVAANINRDFLLSQAEPDDPLATIVRLTLAQLQQDQSPDALLRLTSTIPLGRGLGSGAAVSTAIVRALVQFFQRSLTPDEVSGLVYQVERLHHGVPSGIDNTVIAFEQPVFFVKGYPIQRLTVAQPFTLLIGDTGISASTRQVVGDLRRRWQAQPRQYEGHFDEIGALVRHARLAIEQEIFDVSVLGKLMNENQEVLAALGVSSPELQRLVEAARQAGAWGAKLSGAGWGGNMIVLVPAQPEEAAAAVKEALLAAGAVAVLKTEVK